MSIEDFINNVVDKDFASAQTTFTDLMNTRMQDALDQQKVMVAGSMFGEEEDEIDDEQLELDLEDEEDEEDLEEGEDLEDDEGSDEEED